MVEEGYVLRYSNLFKKQYKRLARSGNVRALEETDNVLDYIFHTGSVLLVKYKNHKLVGELEGLFECHILPDWLLVYDIDEKENIITFVALGSHSSLFK